MYRHKHSGSGLQVACHTIPLSAMTWGVHVETSAAVSTLIGCLKPVEATEREPDVGPEASKRVESVKTRVTRMKACPLRHALPCRRQYADIRPAPPLCVPLQSASRRAQQHSQCSQHSTAPECFMKSKPRIFFSLLALCYLEVRWTHPGSCSSCWRNADGVQLCLQRPCSFACRLCCGQRVWQLTEGLLKATSTCSARQ